jgi:hypothetical protein
MVLKIEEKREEEWRPHQRLSRRNDGNAVRDTEDHGGIRVLDRCPARQRRASRRRPGQVNPECGRSRVGKKSVIRTRIEQAIPHPTAVRPAEDYRYKGRIPGTRATQRVDRLSYVSSLVGKAHRISQTPKDRLIQSRDIIEDELQRVFSHIAEEGDMGFVPRWVMNLGF